VEGFVANREIGDDVALDCGFEQRPLEPRRIPQVAALDAAGDADPHPNENVAAKTFDDRHSFARRVLMAAVVFRVDRTIGQLGKYLLDQPDGLFHLVHAYPKPSVYIAVLEHGDFEFEFVIGGVARPAARVAAPT